MKSIKTKIFVIVLSGIIAASVIVGGFGIFWSNIAVKRDSGEILDLIAQVQTQGLNSMFADVEQSSSVLSYYLIENLSASNIFQNTQNLSKCISDFKDTAWYIANCTPHVISVGVKFAPGISDGKENFFWTKRNGVFVQEESFNDGWYSKAPLQQEGIWTEPYYNEDINEYVVSFVIPVYYYNKLIAVIGMNIDFDDIASVVNSISIYETGYAFLTDKDFKILYHRKIPAGTGLFDNVTEFKKIEIYGTDLEFYKYTKITGTNSNKKKNFRMSYKNLDNGMKLVVSVPAEEIDRNRNRLLLSLVLSGLAISLLVSLWSVLMSNRISRPLKELAESAKHIIAGNYDVKFTHVPDDEIGDLMGIFAFMATSLKRQFEYINGLAYLDAMTGVKNKRAFIDIRDEINAKIVESKQKNETYEFGVVVFDVNNLKYMNDNFGHKAGDTLIKSACNLIMRNFVYSSVFRIGGDEFVAVLTDKDYKNREELLVNLNNEMTASLTETSPDAYSVSLAAGMSIYNPSEDENFQSVFERADEEMYRAKIEMKGESR